MRLQKLLAQAGIASRRKAVEIIRSGFVQVNEQVITEKGFAVDTAKDKIKVYGKPIRPEGNVYILLNKPKNCICTTSDTHLRKTVIDLLGAFPARVYSAGRLDKNTTGLLLLTNDGELAYRLTHPRFGVEKIYEALVKGVVNQGRLEKLKKGIFVNGKKTSPSKVKIIFGDKTRTKLKLQIHEGRKHQVRLMLLTAGYPVIDLKRTNFGSLSLGSLKTGRCRMLTASEITGLKRLVGL